MENNRKYYLGLDVGGTNMVAGVIDENFSIVAKASIPTRAGRSIEEVTADMADISKQAVDNARLKLDDISSYKKNIFLTLRINHNVRKICNFRLE